jgi:arsenical pump membrane protein
MALPWLLVIAAEFVAFRWFFRSDLEAPILPSQGDERVLVPRTTVVVLAATLAGFVVTSFVNVNPAWAALGGAVVLGGRALLRRRTTPAGLVAAASPLFLLFVLALGVVVDAVVVNGLGRGLGTLLPGGSSLPALLAVAAIAGVLANLINNLPAVLALLPIVAASGPGPVLAVLLGVNLGPNLTYVGSLATLLWRRIAREHEAEPGLGQFTRLGAITVPVTLVVATVALWAGLQITGH